MSNPIPWIHIEYAAGNYGNSLTFGNIFGRSNYDVIHQTITKMVRDKGPRGVFYVNDLIEAWAQMAAVSLRRHAESRGWNEVEIRVLAGDVTAIALPFTDTAHLKNPRLGLIYLDGTHPFFTTLADHCRTGLEITTHYPKILLAQAKVGGWKVESLGSGERYRFPSGRRRRLPTERFVLRPTDPITEQQVRATFEKPLGRPWADYREPMPTWKKSLCDTWHAFLVTLGIRRQ